MVAVFSVMFIWADRNGWMEPEYIENAIRTAHDSYSGQITVAAAVIILLIADILLPVPSSIVMAVSGKFLGPWLGGTVSFTGAMLAAWIAFMACRLGGHRIFLKLVGEKDNARITDWFNEYGVLAIIISRPIPMLTEILSCIAGMSDMSLRKFTFASILGTLPICFIYSFVGSCGELTDPWPAIWVSLIIPAAGWLVANRLKNRRKHGS